MQQEHGPAVVGTVLHVGDPEPTAVEVIDLDVARLEREVGTVGNRP